jgi:hypothetical protein
VTRTGTRAVVFGAIASVACASAYADPWLSPGDAGIRSDIQLLADAGMLRGPVTTWPLSWPDIARDVVSAEGKGLDAATADALIRIRRRARAASASGFSGLGAKVSAAHRPEGLRGFEDSPREEAEASVRASWLTNRFAMNLQGTYAVDPDDDREWRPDGTYVGVNVANFMVSAGWMERWWGPGWDGSLILSTNARPIPSVTVERNYTDAFETPLLSWIGPWRASIAVGEAEDHDVAVPGVRFLAARVNFRPRPWLEFGLTRTAQWCGGDRPCGWSTFTDMLIGRDNQTEDGTPSDLQPGNQMAGYDFRLRSPWKKLPLAVYSQWIGEDEAGGLPAKFIGLAGAETWFSSPLGGLRIRAEYTDTTCNFMREQPLYGCAYRNAIYPQGYTFRGRVIGHPMDNDSRQTSLGAILTRPNGDVASLTIRRVELNRDGGEHVITPVPLEYDNVELRYSREFGFGRVTASLGAGDKSIPGDPESGVRGFVSWQQGF